MPLVQNFSVSQNSANPSILIFTDSSTGSDAAVTSRTAYIQLPNGDYLGLSGEVSSVTGLTWPYGQTSISFSVLPRSMATTILVNWVDVNNNILYSKTIKYCFDLADYIFLFGLTMQQVTNNAITQDTAWYTNKMKMITNLADAENAIIYGNDTTLSQNSLDRNWLFIQNQNDFF
jgi:hypothetical protein